MSKTVTERCNVCDKVKRPDKEFLLYFANCGHLVCDDCKTTETCPLCNKDTTYVKLDDSLSDNLKLFFQDPSDMIKFYGKIVEFQNLQNNLAQSSSLKQRKSLQIQVSQLQKENKEKTKEIQLLKAKCSNLEQELEKRETQVAALAQVNLKMPKKKTSSEDRSKFEMTLKNADTKSTFFDPSQVSNNKQTMDAQKSPYAETENSDTYINRSFPLNASPNAFQRYKAKTNHNQKNKLTFDNLEYNLK